MNTLPLHVIYHCILPFKLNPIFGVNKEWDEHEKELLKWKKEVIFKNKVYEYVTKGYRNYVKFCIIEYRADKWNEIAYSAALGGHKDILYDMIERGANNWNRIASGAAAVDHKDILYDMIERGANNWNRISSYAVLNGHKDILYDLIKRGADDWIGIVRCAERFGHYELAKEIKEKYLK